MNSFVLLEMRGLLGVGCAEWIVDLDYAELHFS